MVSRIPRGSRPAKMADPRSPEHREVLRRVAPNVGSMIDDLMAQDAKTRIRTTLGGRWELVLTEMLAMCKAMGILTGSSLVMTDRDVLVFLLTAAYAMGRKYARAKK